MVLYMRMKNGIDVDIENESERKIPHVSCDLNVCCDWSVLCVMLYSEFPPTVQDYGKKV